MPDNRARALRQLLQETRDCARAAGCTGHMRVSSLAYYTLEYDALRPHFAQMASAKQSRVKVWFDGACPLCLREIALMRRFDRGGAIDFVDVSKSGDPSCPIDQADLLARFHAEEDGQVLSGAAAFAAMWRAIPVFRPLGLMARNRAILAVLERLYIVFLRVRPRLQKLLS